MILGGKLPGKVGRCRFLFCKIFLQYRGKIAVMLSFFLLATSLLSERMVSFDPLCGIAARKETMKLAGLRLRVIWTLPVFYYLDLRIIEIKNCAQAQEPCDTRLFVCPNILQLQYRMRTASAVFFHFVCPAKLNHTSRCKSGHGNRQ